MADDDLTQEELDKRAGELARRVMNMPHKKQEWTKGKKPSVASRSGAAAKQARKPRPQAR